jgi:hypothetical protein
LLRPKVEGAAVAAVVARVKVVVSTQVNSKARTVRWTAKRYALSSKVRAAATSIPASSKAGAAVARVAEVAVEMAEALRSPALPVAGAVGEAVWPLPSRPRLCTV